MICLRCELQHNFLSLAAGEAKEVAMALGLERGLTYINGYDHPDVIAGASAALALLQGLS